MGYDAYRDSNGVTWTVVTPSSGKGFTMMATVLDTADPKYDPEPEDITVSMAQGGVQVGGIDIIPTAPPTGEQTRVLFTELVGKVEEYAKQHRGATSLKVTASAGVPWWVWVGLGALVLYKRR